MARVIEEREARELIGYRVVGVAHADGLLMALVLRKGQDTLDEVLLTAGVLNTSGKVPTVSDVRGNVLLMDDSDPDGATVFVDWPGRILPYHELSTEDLFETWARATAEHNVAYREVEEHYSEEPRSHPYWTKVVALERRSLDLREILVARADCPSNRRMRERVEELEREEESSS